MNVHPVLNSFLRDNKGDLQASPVREEKEWRQIMTEADQHALTPLFYRWLCQSGLDTYIPQTLCEQLKSRIFGIAARNLLLTKELGNVLKALAEREIPCISLRGPSLARLLYGDISLRPMGDLDLLVHKRDLLNVSATLTELGYAEMDRRPGFARNFSYTLKFIKEIHGWVIVEPHWTIAYPPFTTGLKMDEVWSRAVRGKMEDVHTWFLSKEDLLLHLCLHIVHREQSTPLLWLYELDRLIRTQSGSILWDQLLLTANESGQAFLVAQALNRLLVVFQTPIPDEVYAQLRGCEELRLEQLSNRSFQRRVTGLFLKDGCIDGRESFALFFHVKGIRAKIRYVSAILFPTLDFMVLQYGLSNRWQVLFAYFRRLAFLLREGLKGLVTIFHTARHSEPSPPQ